MIEYKLGSCVEVLKKMKDDSVDFSFTSPPHYPNNNWFEMNVNVINELLRVTKNHIIYNIQTNDYNRADVYKMIGLFSEKIIDIHIWEKSNTMPAGGEAITNAVEYFIVLGNKSLKSNETYTKNIITTAAYSSMHRKHKAVLRYEVAEHFIKNFTKENETILDCFVGNGTTAIACANLNRNCIGI